MDLFQPCFDDTNALGPVATYRSKDLVVLGSNDYLGLARHPEVVGAARDAIGRFGPGCSGSRLLNGSLVLHRELERELADFFDREAALVFSSDFMTNTGIAEALGCPEWDVIFAERENHASLMGGTRLSRAGVRLFSGPDDLAEQLAERSEWPQALVVSDGVYSTTGRVADLRRVQDLRERYGFRLYLDDSHGIGVLGPRGQGTAPHLGVSESVDIVFGTFSNALASRGGFVVGDGALIDRLRRHTLSMVFSAALSPASAAAALAALCVMRKDPGLFDRLRSNVSCWREGVARAGFPTVPGQTSIVPLQIGSESQAFRMACELLELGVFATPVLHPAVPSGHALIRTTVGPAHTPEHLSLAIHALDEVRKRHGIHSRWDELPRPGLARAGGA
jgi:8-amino-7-oxononanoate synthase